LLNYFNSLEYDPETGAIYKNGTLVKLHRMGGTKSEGEYLAHKNTYAHRIAFFLMTGRWPKYVDHINGDKTDNRWCNLREATMAQNKANESLRSSNKSGLKGVSWHKAAGKWEAHGTKYLGLYDCPAAAHFVYLIDANKKYGDYHRGL
jgi:hypothetical protein